MIFPNVMSNAQKTKSGPKKKVGSPTASNSESALRRKGRRLRLYFSSASQRLEKIEYIANQAEVGRPRILNCDNGHGTGQIRWCGYSRALAVVLLLTKTSASTNPKVFGKKGKSAVSSLLDVYDNARCPLNAHLLFQPHDPDSKESPMLNKVFYSNKGNDKDSKNRWVGLDMNRLAPDCIEVRLRLADKVQYKEVVQLKNLHKIARVIEKQARWNASTLESNSNGTQFEEALHSEAAPETPAIVPDDRKILPSEGQLGEGKKDGESENSKLLDKITSENPHEDAIQFQKPIVWQQAQPDPSQAEMDDLDIYDVPQFVDLANRATKKSDLLNLIAAHTSVSVAGLSGSGKSFLVASFLNGHSRFQVKGAVIWHDPDQSGDESLEALMEKLNRPMRLHAKSLLDKCKQLMRVLESNNQMLIIDDFQSVNKRSYSKLIEAASRLKPPARLVLISQTNIGMTADIPDVPHLDVSGFDEHELRRFLTKKNINISDDNLIKKLLKKTDGLPIAADWFAHMVNSLKRDPEQLLGGTMTTSARLQSWFNDVVTTIGEPAWNVLRMLSLCDGPFNEGVVRILCQQAGSESFEKLFEALQRAYLVQSYSPFRWRLHHLIVDFSRLGMAPEFAERIHSVLGNYHWKKSQWIAKGVYAEEALIWQAKACRHFQNARDFERSNKTVHRMIKEAKSRGFYWLIIRLLGDELEMNPTKDGWLAYNYAHCCLIVGRYKQCLAAIKPLASQPLLDDPDLKMSSVRIYADLLDATGQPRFALDQLQKLLDSDVVKSASRIVVAQAKAVSVRLLTKLKIYDRAAILSEELLNESISEIAKAVALAGWGVVLECEGQYQLADEKLGQAVSLFVNKDYRGLGWSLSHQAVCQMKMNHPAGASLMLEEALKIKSDIDEASEEYLAFLRMAQPLPWERGLPNIINTEIQRVSTRIRGFEK